MQAFDYCISMLRRAWADRKPALRAQDAARESDPNWYRRRDLLGMMMYTNAFAGTLKGVEEKLPYIQECGRQLPAPDAAAAEPQGPQRRWLRGGGFPHGGTGIGHHGGPGTPGGFLPGEGHEPVSGLRHEPHQRGPRVGQKGPAGEPGYRERYFFYDNWDIPNEFEKTVPQVFPTTAPGSFTWLDDCQQVVMTNFYPYQWDLNYANPVVFNDMTENLLYLTNRGIDVIRLDAVPISGKSWAPPAATCPRSTPWCG